MMLVSLLSVAAEVLLVPLVLTFMDLRLGVMLLQYYMSNLSLPCSWCQLMWLLFRCCLFKRPCSPSLAVVEIFSCIHAPTAVNVRPDASPGGLTNAGIFEAQSMSREVADLSMVLAGTPIPPSCNILEIPMLVNTVMIDMDVRVAGTCS
jgi:hypothetical protein